MLPTHYHQPSISTYPSTKLLLPNHDNKSKPPLCLAKHHSHPCFHLFNRHRNTTGSSQTPLTPKRSPSWLYQWDQNLHMQEMRWSCVEKVSFGPILSSFFLRFYFLFLVSFSLLLFLLLFSIQMVEHIANNKTAKHHVPHAKAPVSQVQGATPVLLEQWLH
jgi:hypothetical protein